MNSTNDIEKLLGPLSGLLNYFNNGILETFLAHSLVSDFYRANRKLIAAKSNTKRSAVQMIDGRWWYGVWSMSKSLSFSPALQDLIRLYIVRLQALKELVMKYRKLLLLEPYHCLWISCQG